MNSFQSSGRIKFVMIIPDQIFFVIYHYFSSTKITTWCEHHQDSQTQFVSTEICGWEKIDRA